MSEQVKWMKKNKKMIILAPFVLKALCEVLNICIPGQENSWLVGRGGLYGGMGPGGPGQKTPDNMQAEAASRLDAFLAIRDHKPLSPLPNRSPGGSRTVRLSSPRKIRDTVDPFPVHARRSLSPMGHQHKAIAAYAQGKIRAIITRIKANPKTSGVSALFVAFLAAVLWRFSKKAKPLSTTPESAMGAIFDTAKRTPLKPSSPDLSPSSSKGLFDAFTAAMQEHGLSYIAAAVATVTAISGLAYIFYRKYARLGSPREQKQQKRDARGRWTGSPKKDLRSISDTELSDTKLALKYSLVDARGHIDKQALRKLKQQIARRAPKKGGQLISPPIIAQQGGNSNPIKTTVFTASPKQVQFWKDCQKLWKKRKYQYVLKGCR
ncbi:hypothetical protein EMVG_00299 [Emiliania huxleyi virus PS401]|nr:hypothetical protein EMVG_00299 [Emiliania huxleyi virus PS401]